MNNSSRQNSNATRNSSPNPRNGAFKPRKRGTRGARRAGSPGNNSTANNSSAQQKGQDIKDPVARQQMKQTMAIALITTPVVPLPFPLSIILGLTTLIYPSDAKNRDEE
ncbi:hypothetical protein EDB80DRAFT_203415 [Ilyonectria destructans]|nr:hypothetical protein EDB80DRAFT_203415 [Ilyonectria destructans]